METVFDVGMYDGADTTYYLDTGHRVVAIEANPMMCEAVAKKLKRHIDAGRLVIENVAVSNEEGVTDLHICGQDLGSSSIVVQRLLGRQPLASFSVPTTTVRALIAKHGTPKYLKLDIEGADKYCVMSLVSETAPQYLSFEAHKDIEELIEHTAAIGYGSFKIINQNSFLSIQRQHGLGDRIKRKLIRMTGYDAPTVVRRDGRAFTLEHSTGPAPWRSDGPFYSRAEIIAAWRKATANNLVRGWYDVHAALS